MCLYPTLIKNRKYLPNKKNGRNPPPVIDERTKYVPVGCGVCIECKKQKQRNWQVRLLEHIKTHTNGKFITLTFSDESYTKLATLVKLESEIQIDGYQLDNQIATKAVRLFLERYRKLNGHSLTHWLITELGHNGTENIHLHGIIWTNDDLNEIEKIWSYGYMWKGKKTRVERAGLVSEQLINYVNDKTIGYITKYVSKTDLKHKTYQQKILTSPGIGADYMKRNDIAKNKYNHDKTIETYKTQTGHTISLPIYYRNKLYTETEKEQLWINRLDKQERYVLGEKIDISKGEQEYYAALPYARRLNIELGYQSPEQKTIEQQEYERHQRRIQQATRIAKARKKNGVKAPQAGGASNQKG